MDVPRVVSREEWLVARRELLTAERDAAEERMALSAERAALPMVKIGVAQGFAVGQKDAEPTLRARRLYLDLTPLGRQDDGVLRHHDRDGG